MNTTKQASRRFWAVMIAALLILGQVKAVSAHQPGGDFQQQGPGCKMVQRVDPAYNYQLRSGSVPPDILTYWDVVCFAEVEAASLQVNNSLMGIHTICSPEVRVDPWDYYPIGGSGVPTGRNAVLEVVCTP